MGDHTLRVGWLGTGRMGSAMARRLIAAGEELTAWNRTRSKADVLGAAHVADKVTELATLDIVFVTVSAPQDFDDVLLGENGLMSAGAAPGIVVDCSTIDVATSHRVRTALGAFGTHFVAAPVSGNPHVVAEGEAVFVASGPAEAYETVQPLLAEIARQSIWVGPQEQARLVKIAHNLYLGVLVQALSEVTVLAEKSGVSRDHFLHFLNSTVLATDWVRKRTPEIVTGSLTTTFTTELLRKDFDLGLDAARSEEVPMPLASATMQLIQQAIGRGYRNEDFLSLLKVQAASSGIRYPADQT